MEKEQRLWKAVIEQAERDTKSSDALISVDARKFLTNDTGVLRYVCSAAGVCMDDIIRRWTDEEPKRRDEGDVSSDNEGTGN